MARAVRRCAVAACYWKAGRARGDASCLSRAPGCAVVTASPEPPCARPHSQPVRSHGTSARSSQTPHPEGTLTFHKSILHLGQSHLPELVRVLCPAPPPHAPAPASSLTWNLPGNVSPWVLAPALSFASNSLHPQRLAPSLPCVQSFRTLPAHGIFPEHQSSR